MNRLYAASAQPYLDAAQVAATFSHLNTEVVAALEASPARLERPMPGTGLLDQKRIRRPRHQDCPVGPSPYDASLLELLLPVVRKSVRDNVAGSDWIR